MTDNLASIQAIAGLHYQPDFINQTEQAQLIEAIDAEVWLTELKRRVQHYGYKYDYKARKIDASMKIADLPTWADFITQKLENQLQFEPNQLIINEYEPGQGIAPHIDCEPCFEDTIVSISLLSAWVMDFRAKNDKNTQASILLEPKSIIILQKEARYDWLHGIKARQTDDWQGERIVRQRRISLTFRRVILGLKD
jgi:alkylated DNA repair dioxygenase AlkB